MKNTIKKISLLFAVVLMIALFAVSASAVTEGYYTYEVENGEATITEVDDSISGDVIIPSELGGYPVTEIGDWAFSPCENLTSVTIGGSVTTIGDKAFSYCDNLTSVTIFDSVTTIGEGAFSYCYSLTSATIPDSVATLSDFDFENCYSLTRVAIPDSVTTIGDYAFGGCNSLTSVTIPDCVTIIGFCAFTCCDSLTSVTIPDSITTIGIGAFNCCDSLTSVTIPNSVTAIGASAFLDCNSLANVYYNGTEGQWKNISVGEYNDTLTNAIIHFLIEENIYNLGEETYQFKNYSDSKSDGHCFGMSITSSGYYLGKLDISDIGGNNKDGLYSLTATTKVKSKICDYQKIQGSIRDAAMVAGGTNYKNSKKYDIKGDWKEVIDYVKNHNFDYKGSLQIGYKGKYTNKEGKLVEGGHAINFIRYEVVNGQPRIYAYDNNMPTVETYFYQNENGEVLQAPYSTFTGSIDCITLRDVSTYFTILKGIDIFTTLNKPLIFYAFDNSVSIEGAYVSMMDGVAENGVQYMYEIPEGQTEVKIIPLVDNATFTYMDEEYSFGKIDEDTYAEFTLSTSEDETPEMVIINAPEENPSENCSCNCHKGGIAGFFFKLILFFQKIFRTNKTCSCGVNHY